MVWSPGVQCRNQFLFLLWFLEISPQDSHNYGWSALLADSECFSGAAALAVFCSNFDGRICISDFRPSTQIALRNSTLPYLLKVTSLWACGVLEDTTSYSTKTECEPLALSSNKRLLSESG